MFTHRILHGRLLIGDCGILIKIRAYALVGCCSLVRNSTLHTKGSGRVQRSANFSGSTVVHIHHLSGRDNRVLGCWTNTIPIREEEVFSDRNLTSAFPRRHIPGDRLRCDRKYLAIFVESSDIMVDRFH